MTELSLLPERLLPWFQTHRRELPWRRDREPYHVWVSEIMLQQTRVEAVKGYYERFLQSFPDVRALACAQEETLLKLWEGLGYYSRARNLQKAARCIVERGGFPDTPEALRALPGIGAYTAGAICSICFEQPTPAVDGNVLRVLSRYLADASPVTDEKVKRQTAQRLARVYPHGHCGDFTQALMELGATVCLPNGAPLCDHCPLCDLCAAKRVGMQQLFPVKAAKKPRRVEKRTVLLLRCDGRIAVCKRPARGLLAGLWQFPDVEGELTDHETLALAEELGLRPRGIEKIVRRSHIFTHVQWEMTGVYLTCGAQTRYRWVTPEELRSSVSLPTAYRQFFDPSLF